MPEKTNNKRVKDEVHDHENAQWGFSDNMNSFVGKVQEKFPNIRITSGKRESSGHHHAGDAVDIGVRRENDKEALAMYEWLMNEPEGLSLLVSHGLGVIDETNPENMAKTGATGPHFHIGPDSKYSTKPKERLGQFDNYYAYPDREGVKYKKEGDKWLVNLGKETQGQYKPINDPTGSRSKELSEKAVPVNVKPTWESSFYASHLDHDYSKPYTSTGNTTPLEKPTDPPIPFELVRGTPEFNFLQDIKDIKTKQDIQTEKEKESEARKNIIAKQKAEDEQRQMLIDAISQNKPSERPQEQPSRNQVREPRQQEIELQSQTQLPSLPSLMKMPQFEQEENPKFQDGGEFGHDGSSIPFAKLTPEEKLEARKSFEDFVGTPVKDFDGFQISPEAWRAYKEEGKPIPSYWTDVPESLPSGTAGIPSTTQRDSLAYFIQDSPRDTPKWVDRPAYQAYTGSKWSQRTDAEGFPIAGGERKRVDPNRYVKAFQDGGDMIVDSKGQYNHPGKNTRVPSNKITMRGINYPVYGVPNVGEPVMMQPDQEYIFDGAEYVDEYPMMKGFHMMPDGTMMRDDQMPEYQGGGASGAGRYTVKPEQFEWEEAPKEETKKKLTEAQKKAQAAFSRDFKTTKAGTLEEIEAEATLQADKAIQGLKEMGREDAVNENTREEMVQRGIDARVDWQNRMPLDIVKQAPERSWLDRFEDIATNPMDAAKYSISGGGIENMPYNYNQMLRAGITPYGSEGNPLTAFNEAINPLKWASDLDTSSENKDYGEVAAGLTWALNPISRMGRKLPKDVMWRKMGNKKGMESMIENKGIISPSNDHLFFSRGNKPNENYKGIYATSYDKSKGTDVDSFRTFSGPGGQHLGLSPVSSEGSMRNVPLTDPGVEIFRRIPFSNAYSKVDKDKILNGDYSPVMKAMDVSQSVAEKIVKTAIWGTVGQEGINSMYGNDEDPNPLGKSIIDIIRELNSKTKPEKTTKQYQDGGKFQGSRYSGLFRR